MVRDAIAIFSLVSFYGFQPTQAEQKLTVVEKLKADIPGLTTLKVILSIIKILPIIYC